jgi:hypothetical protein
MRGANHFPWVNITPTIQTVPTSPCCHLVTHLHGPDGAGKGHPSLSPLPNGPTEGGGAAANGPVPRRGAALAGSHDVLVCGVGGNWRPRPRLGGGVPPAAATRKK